MNIIIVIISYCMILNAHSIKYNRNECYTARLKVFNSCKKKIEKIFSNKCPNFNSEEIYRKLCNINWYNLNPNEDYQFASVYNFNSGRIWKLNAKENRTIKYFVDYYRMYPTYLPEKEIITSAIYDAFKRWGEIISLTFNETINAGEADIFILFPGRKMIKNELWLSASMVESKLRYSTRKINETTTECYNYERIQKAYIEIANSSVIEFNRLIYMFKAEEVRYFKEKLIRPNHYQIFDDLLDPSKFGVLFYVVLLHEIGSILGIDNVVEELPSVMNKQPYRGIHDLQEVDIEAITCLYGYHG